MPPRRRRIWNIIPAIAAPVAVAAIIRLEPADLNLTHPDWNYTWQFARNHACDYTSLTLSALVLAYWFQQDLKTAGSLISKAITAALGIPPLSHAYDHILEATLVLIQKIKRDFNEKIRAQGLRQGRQQGIIHTLRLEHPDADDAEIQRLYEKVVANLESQLPT